MAVLPVLLAAVAAAATPIPQVATGAAPAFTGAPATPRPIHAPPSPRHPFMAPNGSSSLHEDAWQTDASRRAGPLGRDVQVTSAFFARECASVTFDSRGRIVTVCVGIDRPQLVVLDPRTLDTLAALDLPPRESAPGAALFQSFGGGGYFYLDHRDRAVVPTPNRHVMVVQVEADGVRVERDLDLSGAVPAGDSIVSALPDWDDRLWIGTRQGRFGTVDRETGEARLVELEPIGNSFAVAEDGDVYVVTDGALYRYRADAGGMPREVWRRAYANTGATKPGQTQAGSGTTPTLMARRLVAITDNADPMQVVVFTRRGRRVCEVPVFAAGASATDQSLIAAGRSLVVENNFGYSGPAATQFGRTTTPGLERVDVSKDLRTCTRRWRSEAIAPSVVPKVSLPNGLVYTYTKPGGSAADRWYLTALDFRTGKTVFEALAGSGLGFNNNYAPVTIGPDGTAYVGSLGGLVALRDATPPAQPTGSPRPRLRVVARCGRRPVLRGDTDWVDRKRFRRTRRRVVARITLTDGRVVRRSARRPRC